MPSRWSNEGPSSSPGCIHAPSSPSERRCELTGCWPATWRTASRDGALVPTARATPERCAGLAAAGLAAAAVGRRPVWLLVWAGEDELPRQTEIPRATNPYLTACIAGLAVGEHFATISGIGARDG